MPPRCLQITRVAALLSLSALALALAIPGAATGGPAETPLSRAVSDVAPAVAAADVPVITWVAADGASRRVHGVAWPGVEEELGPEWAGSDGTPALAGDGRQAWVATARHSDAGSRLWTRRWRNGSWSRPIPGPVAGSRDHHPALAVDGRHTWMVWVTDSPGGSHLEAASWDGSAWSRAERVPGPDGAPMAPAVAVDSAGWPVIAWSAFDGTDAEIWVARRRGHGWSRAVPVTANDIPDIQPDVGVDTEGVLVTWSRFAGDGYVPMAARGAARGLSWDRPETISTSPGGAPRVVTGRGTSDLVWASPSSDGTGYEIRMATRGRDSWRASSRLASAAGPRFSVADHHDGLLLGWRDGDGPIAATGDVRGRPGQAPEIVLSPLIAAPAATTAAVSLPRLPSAYTGFGDSITEGTVLFQGVIESTRGYPGYLADLLERQHDQPVPVLNRGAPGELTSEGLSRLAGIINLGGATDFMLLMEGTNDVSGLVEPATIAFNLQQMVNLVLEADRMPVLSTLIPFQDAAFEGGLNPRIDTVNEQIRSFARARGVLLVDNHEVFDRAPHLYSDRVHPNEQGYEVMAENWYRELKPIIEAMLLREDGDDGRTADESIELPEHPTSTNTHQPGCC